MRRVGFLVCLLVGWSFSAIFQRYIDGTTPSSTCFRVPMLWVSRVLWLAILTLKRVRMPESAYHQRYIRSWLADSMTKTGRVRYATASLGRGGGGYMHYVISRRPILLSHNLVLRISISDF